MNVSNLARPAVQLNQIWNAVKNGDLEDFKRLTLLYGNTIPVISGWTPMDFAAFHGHLDIVKWYAEILEDPNPARITNDEFNGRTPMHLAAQKGHYDIVVFLSQLVNDTNPSDQNGYTPLHQAATKRTFGLKCILRGMLGSYFY